MTPAPQPPCEKYARCTEECNLWWGCAHKDATAIRKDEREKVLCELLAYIHPDSRAGCVIQEKLKELRGEP